MLGHGVAASLLLGLLSRGVAASLRVIKSFSFNETNKGRFANVRMCGFADVRINTGRRGREEAQRTQRSWELLSRGVAASLLLGLLSRCVAAPLRALKSFGFNEPIRTSANSHMLLGWNKRLL